MLNRRFSPLHLLLISINGMVGSAWLFAPFYAAKIAGPASIIAWIIGGLMTAFIAITFVELSTLFPVAGGSAQIPQITHGKATSFILAWITWLSALMMAPIEVQAVLQYASNYFSSLMHLSANGTPVLTGIGFLWAAILMLFLSLMNIFSFKGLIRFNYFLFFFKIVIMVCVIYSLIKFSFNSSNFNFIAEESFEWKAILTALASGGVAFAFTGFKHGVELAGETKQPSIAIPLGILGSVFFCLLLYLGLQIAFIGSIQPALLNQGWQSLHFVGDIGPFAGLIMGIGIYWLAKLLYLDALISPLGAGLIYVTSTARILYAMSAIGFLPQWIRRVNKEQLPIIAIMINFVIGMFLFLPFPGWQAMVSFLVSGMILSYAIGPISLLSLRQEIPTVSRIYRLPFAYLICPMAFYCCNLLTYWTGWETIYKLSIAMVIGLFFLLVGWLRGKIKNLNIKNAAWLLPYCLGMVLLSYAGAFGGKEWIPFGWDFFVIAIFSLSIFYFAIYCRLPSAMNNQANANLKNLGESYSLEMID